MSNVKCSCCFGRVLERDGGQGRNRTTDTRFLFPLEDSDRSSGWLTDYAIRNCREIMHRVVGMARTLKPAAESMGGELDMTRHAAAIGLIAALTALTVQATEQVEPSAVNRIVDEGFDRSQLPQIAAYLTDRIGGRMTNSPQMRQAETWTQDQYRAWGLKDVHLEGFEFGRGWSIERSSVRMVTPRVKVLRSHSDRLDTAHERRTDGPCRTGANAARAGLHEVEGDVARQDRAGQ